ncbi:hypothetical protein DRP53_06205 [candidate division WOR-3 bacterium]|uniref:Tetratricopeptide repeat protein n=1 Tax=candidate division WOR-3 bacterium TaxID=2052148 RepID=A0A660SH19_UNCW3|nr:MAG: hypothetical protein DRP53_06205 [candidate division WOR-3 bacterium]
MIFLLFLSLDVLLIELGYDHQTITQVEEFLATIEWEGGDLQALANQIKSKIGVQKMMGDTGGYFELDRVLKERKANCLGLTQLLFIYLRERGYRVGAVVGRTHIANLIAVGDSFYIVDLAAQPDPFISSPFLFDSVFTHLTGGYFQLEKKGFFPTPEMRRIYQKILRLDAVAPALYFNRGLVACHRKDYQKALSHFTRAINLNPGYGEVYANRGKVLLLLDRPEEALGDFNQAIRLNPEIASAYAGRAIINLRKNLVAAAIKDCDRALRLDPSLTEAYITRGNGYLREKRYQSAISDYGEALRLEPDRFEAFLNRGLAYLGLNDHPAALRDFNRALILKPDLAEGYLYRGDLYSELKRFDDAIGDYTRAIELKPGLAQAYLNRGIVNFNLRRMDAARSDFRKTYSLNPDLLLDFYHQIERQRHGYLYQMLKRIIAGN